MISVKIKGIDKTYSAHDAQKTAEILKLVCRGEPSVCAHVDSLLAKKDVSSRIASILAFQTLLETCVEAGLDLSALTVEKSELGRPSFARRTDVDFSISHTDGYIAVALATGSGARVGIDVESTARDAFFTEKKRKKIASRFFCKEELRMLEAASENAEKFIELWIRKEAYLKYTGKGIGKMAHTDTLAPLPHSVAFLTDTVGVIGTDAYFTLCYSPLNESPQIKCEV